MWYYNDREITSLNDFPEGAYGFIYIVRNISNGRSYIGKKNLFFERKVNLTKKEISNLANKRAKKYKYVTKESDWLSYIGSCKALLEDVANGDQIVKSILHIAFSKRELTYMEVKYLFTCEVLESDDFYNENIESRYFKGNIK